MNILEYLLIALLVYIAWNTACEMRMAPEIYVEEIVDCPDIQVYLDETEDVEESPSFSEQFVGEKVADIYSTKTDMDLLTTLLEKSEVEEVDSTQEELLDSILVGNDTDKKIMNKNRHSSAIGTMSGLASVQNSRVRSTRMSSQVEDPMLTWWGF